MEECAVPCGGWGVWRRVLCRLEGGVYGGVCCAVWRVGCVEECAVPCGGWGVWRSVLCRVEGGVYGGVCCAVWRVECVEGGGVTMVSCWLVAGDAVL